MTEQCSSSVMGPYFWFTSESGGKLFLTEGRWAGIASGTSALKLGFRLLINRIPEWATAP
jgi:hypothetical protein